MNERRGPDISAPSLARCRGSTSHAQHTVPPDLSPRHLPRGPLWDEGHADRLAGSAEVSQPPAPIVAVRQIIERTHLASLRLPPKEPLACFGFSSRDVTVGSRAVAHRVSAFASICVRGSLNSGMRSTHRRNGAACH